MLLTLHLRNNVGKTPLGIIIWIKGDLIGDYSKTVHFIKVGD
jgi:hypothetical protein